MAIDLRLSGVQAAERRPLIEGLREPGAKVNAAPPNSSREGIRPAPKRALILAGGGLKVAWQAGVLQVWLDEVRINRAPLTFDCADGASGGDSISTAYFLAMRIFLPSRSGGPPQATATAVATRRLPDSDGNDENADDPRRTARLCRHPRLLWQARRPRARRPHQAVGTRRRVWREPVPSRRLHQHCR